MSIKKVFFLLAILVGVVILLLLLMPSLNSTRRYSSRSGSDQARHRKEDLERQKQTAPTTDRLSSDSTSEEYNTYTTKDLEGSNISRLGDYDGDISGGMGGYGGGMMGGEFKYINGDGPVPVIQRKVSQRSRSRYYGMTRNAMESQMMLDARRVPAEILNFSADEIWVIAKSEKQAVSAGEDAPGSGAMLAKLPKDDKEIPLPLKAYRC